MQAILNINACCFADLTEMIEKILLTVDDTTFGEYIFSYKAMNVRYYYYCFLLNFVSDEDNWNDIAIACSSLAAIWRQLCISLGLSFKTICTIKDNNPDDSEGSLNEAFMQWILQNYNTEKHSLPSWKSLLRTVSKVDQPLFETLAKKHQVQGT